MNKTQSSSDADDEVEKNPNVAALFDFDHQYWIVIDSFTQRSELEKKLARRLLVYHWMGAKSSFLNKMLLPRQQQKLPR